MADDSYFAQIINALKGTTPTPPEMAPPLANYPSSADADFARKSGFSQGSPNEAFLDNQAARVIGYQQPIKRFSDAYIKQISTNPKAKPTFTNDTMLVPTDAGGMSLQEATDTVNHPEQSGIVDPRNNPELNDKLNNRMMRAALAANRIPIAAVGFDPNRTAIDSKMPEGATYLGLYHPITDGMYTTIRPKADTDSITHESIHRGIEKLRQQFPYQSKEALKGLPDEEYIVRWLMNQNAGDPESKDAVQRSDAIKMFTGPFGKERQNNLDKLQELAISAMKDRGKRAGPQ